MEKKIQCCLNLPNKDSFVFCKIVTSRCTFLKAYGLSKKNVLQNFRQNLAHLKEISITSFFYHFVSLPSSAPELTSFPNNLDWQD